MHSFQDKLVIYLLKRLCCKISWIIKILSLSRFPTRVFPGYFDQKILVWNLWFAFIDFISVLEARFRVFLFMRKSNFLFICTCGLGIKQNSHWDLKSGWVFKFLHCQGASVNICSMRPLHWWVLLLLWILYIPLTTPLLSGPHSLHV